MAPDQETSERSPVTGPQTPAGRRADTGEVPVGEPQPQPGEIEARRLAPPEVEPEVRPGPEPGPEPAEPQPGPQPAGPQRRPAPQPQARPRPRPAAEPRRRPAPRPQARPQPGPIAPQRSTRERASALLALGSAIGIVAFIVSSLGSAGSPAGGVLEATTSTRTVAPGGRIVVSGDDAPPSTRLVLETRGRDKRWRTAATATSDDDGSFRIEGRVLARPGTALVRANAPGVATGAPLKVNVRPLRLASVGDINLGDVPGQGIAANGAGWPWQSVRRPLREADIAFGNLESPVSERGTPFPKQFNFRGTPAALAGLRRHSGIDVLNLANNHTGDYGPEAMLDTVRGVERLGMKAVGAGPDLDRALAPQIVERLGLRIGFVGFSNIAPVEFAATEDGPGTAWATPESVAAAVRAARRRADIVVATFHWGIEKQTIESADQRALADVAVDAGAQLVIGAHPHSLQPVRREGPALIAFSLGNFVFGAHSYETSTTGILELDLTAEGVSRARWRAGRISGGRPLLDRARPRRLPLKDDLTMKTGYNLYGSVPGL